MEEDYELSEKESARNLLPAANRALFDPRSREAEPPEGENRGLAGGWAESTEKGGKGASGDETASAGTLQSQPLQTRI